MAITPKHVYGWKMEQALRPYIEEYLDDHVYNHTYRYDTVDMESSVFDIELKARPVYSSLAFDRWMVPKCKFTSGLTDVKNKPLLVFYYWAKDETLWDYTHVPGAEADWEVILNENNQETYLIPRHLFTKVF